MAFNINGGGLKLKGADGTAVGVDGSNRLLVALNYTGSLTGLDDTPSSYDDGKFLQSTTSGTQWAQPDHGSMGGLSDDDHTQYILANGTRDFGGIVKYDSHPTFSADEQLIDKRYVDEEISTIITNLQDGYEGYEAIVSGTNTVEVSIGATLPDTDYSPSYSIRNTTDAVVSSFTASTIATTTSGFTVELSGYVPTGNYYLDWRVGGSTIYGGVLDHGELTGLSDDDHPQYLNTTRGDARYYTETELNAGQLDNRYYTETELDAGQLDTRYYTETEVDAFGYIANLSEDTSPQLGADLDLNGKCIDYGTILTGNGEYNGEKMTVVVDDIDAAFGNVLYQAADFHYERADADSISTSPVFVVALEAGNGTKEVLLKGQVCNTAWNWSAGKIYLSTTTGGMTQIKPSGSGDQVQVLGWALSADTIFFDPVTMVVEI